MLIVLRIQLRNKHKCNFHYQAMLMTMSQILKSVDFTKTQKSRYFEYEKLKGVLQERKTSKFRYKWYLQKISG